MTRFHFEVWAPKGERALCTFDYEADAWRMVDEREHVVPGLRVEIVTTTTRRKQVERREQRSIAA